MIVSVILPAVIFTLMVDGTVVGGVVGGVGFSRLKLILLPIVLFGEETVNEPVPVTPGVVTVAVNVPDPVVVLVAVWPHRRVWVFGRTIKVVGVVGGGASPAGPATPTTDGDSITRLSASVTMSELVPQPLWVTR